MISNRFGNKITHWNPNEKDDSKYDIQIETKNHKKTEMILRDIIEKQIRTRNVRVMI